MKETRTRKSSGEKRSRKKKRIEKQVTEVNYSNTEEHKIEEAFEEKKKKRASKKSKKHHVTNIAESSTVENEVKTGFDESDGTGENKENEENKLRKKKRKLGREKRVSFDVDGDYDNGQDGARENKGKSKKARTIKKKDHRSTTKDEKLPGKTEESKQEEVYEMSSGDEDCSRGMKKWIMEYRKSRPGLDILQERIDAFIEAHEEQEKKAREEKEALAAEGGWTVVVHHKGRKKTTDAESGIAVGSVAQAAVLENMAKKKKNEVGLDFYRFQKRDAKRSEIMALQSKFEQDKKRIQQLRAARKFRPY